MKKRFLHFLFTLLLCTLSASAEQVVEGFSLPINDELIKMRDGLYQGSHHDPIDYNLVDAGYSLEVVSDPTPAAQKLDKFGVSLRKLPMQLVHTRCSTARIGSWPALVLEGGTMMPDKKSAHLLAVIVVTDDKAYRFTQISRYAPSQDAVVAQLGAFALGDQKLTDYPTDRTGEYRLQDAPLGVEWSGYPYILAFNEDIDYAVSYDAAAEGTPDGVAFRYYLRKLKPDDKRPDSEIFYALAAKSGLPKEATPDLFQKTLVDTDKPDWSRRYSFKRKGDWVAVLVRAWPPDKALPSDGQIKD